MSAEKKYLWFTVWVMFFVSGCKTEEIPTKPAPTVQNVMTVYKSPTCGCCEDWVEHIKEAGFEVRVEHPRDLSAIKTQFGIGQDLQSCHTTVMNGFFFEGHVPADDIKRFLIEKPANAAGLAVPGMPAGSPGMEMPGKKDAYQVVLVTKQGERSVYAQH